MAEVKMSTSAAKVIAAILLDVTVDKMRKTIAGVLKGVPDEMKSEIFQEVFDFINRYKMKW